MQRRHLLTIFLDADFVVRLDKARGSTSRGRFIEALARLPRKAPQVRISREAEETLREIETEPVLRRASRRHVGS
jgi:hypothetical protein